MGRFTVRLPDSLHQQLEAQARIEGVSLNQYVVYSLTQSVSSAVTIQLLPESEIQQQRKRFEALLEQLGAPDRSVAEAFLANRDQDTPNEDEAALIAQAQAKISKSANVAEIL
ncbi:MAG: toxin-antitoxin system HicB family antitoxin [Anaerolineales bacterium]|nr:toxin-antitoxin system HicB family antitoxin [Anaerolineales bacterium]